MKNLTTEKIKYLLTGFYMGKLVEAGFIESSALLRPLGFDLAMDQIESGARLSEAEAKHCCIKFGVTPEDSDLVARGILDFQNKFQHDRDFAGKIAKRDELNDME